MKTTVTTVEKTIYTCDVEGCSFSTEDSCKAKLHYGEKHAAKQTIVGRSHGSPETCLRFDSRNDYWAYCEARRYSSFGRLVNKEDYWKGPGWYFLWDRVEGHTNLTSVVSVSWYAAYLRERALEMHDEADRDERTADQLLHEFNLPRPPLSGTVYVPVDAELLPRLMEAAKADQTNEGYSGDPALDDLIVALRRFLGKE